ncbi:MAG TPA: hypothetical protein VN039_03855 [Nitrospira sp.]|nr:hypothetical protein [Nitrospira sp.]
MISLVWRIGDTPVPVEILETRAMVSPSMETDIVGLEKCVCGEVRVMWENDPRDRWKHHFDYCPAYDENK